MSSACMPSRGLWVAEIFCGAQQHSALERVEDEVALLSVLAVLIVSLQFGASVALAYSSLF